MNCKRTPAISKPIPCNLKTKSLSIRDEILVCNGKTLSKASVGRFTQTSCTTQFVQVQNGVVGVSQKDRFSITDDSQVNIPGVDLQLGVTVPFTLTPVDPSDLENLVNCKNNWNSPDVYRPSQNGLYQVLCNVRLSVTFDNFQMGDFTSLRVRIFKQLIANPTQQTILADGAYQALSEEDFSLSAQTVVELTTLEQLRIILEEQNASTVQYSVALDRRTLTIIEL